MHPDGRREQGDQGQMGGVFPAYSMASEELSLRTSLRMRS